jgi:small-conductance mechanosensitive channel
MPVLARALTATSALAWGPQGEGGALDTGREIGPTAFERVAAWGLGLLPSLVILLFVAGLLALLGRLLDRASPGDPSAGFRRQVVMLAVTLIGGLFVLLALPLSGERMGGLLSLIGLIVSAAIALSATTFLSNAMAGVMIRAVRNFRVGDFLQVGEHFGRVTESELFHTEIQTEDRDLLTLPNLHLVTNPVKVVRRSGTIVSATVSLGYDAPRDRVVRLLLEAAGKAGLEEPFVQVVELQDHAVVYRAAGLLREVKHLISTRSHLRAAMVDALHAGGIEIVSPRFVRQLVVPLAEAEPVIPPMTVQPTAETGAALEELAFDKAEAMTDLDELRRAYAAGEETRRGLDRELDDAGGAGGDAARRATLAERRARLTAHLEELERRITAREARRDEEGA